MSFDEYLLIWSKLHGDAVPSKVVRGWLWIGFQLSSPLIRLSANTITVFGALLSVLLVGHFYGNRAEYLLTAVGVLILGMVDSLDGIVAVRKSKTSSWGAFLDSVVDRLVDVSFGILFFLCGAPFLLCVFVVCLTLIHEYMRARASGLGMADVGVISVGEKPTRVAIVIMFFLSCAMFSDHAKLISTFGAVIWLFTSAVGLGQLYKAIKNTLKQN